jgi:predicted phage terminase large subunit-like protein
MNLSPVKAAELLLQRRAIRKSLTLWCQVAGYEPAAHHLLLIDKLEAVARGEITRLMVFMPPGSAKSTYTSILFPAWFLAQNPLANILAASHTQELASRWGRKVRNLISEHSATLGLELSDDSQAADRWELKQGGAYLASGVGGAITGWRADIAIIDDPVKSAEDAASETIQTRNIEWWNSDLMTRLRPGARVVVVSTRWHESDLCGKLLEAQANGGDQWEVLCLPAEAQENDPLGRKPGEFLWSDQADYRYDHVLEHAKATQPPYVWNALYQQNPTPDSGGFIRREWLHLVDAPPPPDTMNIYMGCDFATIEGRGDFTSFVVCGLDPANKLWVLDVFREQASTDRWINAFCSIVKQWRPIAAGLESGQIKNSVGPFLLSQMRAQQAFTYCAEFPSRHSKEIRAQSIRGKISMDGLYIPNAPWRQGLVTELLHFPNGKFDDQLDALSLIGQLIDKTQPGSVRQPQKKRPTIDWARERLIKIDGPPSPMPSFRIKI